MELKINQSLQAQPPHLDLLPDLMLADVPAEVDLDRSRIVLMTFSGSQGATVRALCSDGFCGQMLFFEYE